MLYAGGNHDGEDRIEAEINASLAEQHEQWLRENDDLSLPTPMQKMRILIFVVRFKCGEGHDRVKPSGDSIKILSRSIF
jgi:hypothetical protein